MRNDARASMTVTAQEIQSYYDQQVVGKLRGFVEGNARVERAWQTLEQWVCQPPQRILEVGCGIGDNCWRMASHWPESTVVGLDISPRSLEVAKRLFESARVSFVAGPLTPDLLAGSFELIVLMDVYEHIAVGDRPILHSALKQLRSSSGQIILTIPTPRHLDWLRHHKPEAIQPIDEAIDLTTILTLAQDTETEVLAYYEVDVWHRGDYAHAVLGTRSDWTAVMPDRSITVKAMVQRWLARQTTSRNVERSRRLALVQQRLGIEAYSVGGNA